MKITINIKHSSQKLLGYPILLIHTGAVDGGHKCWKDTVILAMDRTNGIMLKAGDGLNDAKKKELNGNLLMDATAPCWIPFDGSVILSN